MPSRSLAEPPDVDERAGWRMPLRDRRDVRRIEAACGRPWQRNAHVGELLRAGLASQPDRDAVVHVPDAARLGAAVRVSRRELLAQIVGSANVFRSLGVEPRRPLAVLIPNLPQVHAVLWGGAIAGGALPLNWMLEAEHLEHLFRVGGAAAVVLPPPGDAYGVNDKFERIAARLPAVRRVVVGATDGGLDTLRRRVDHDRLAFAPPGPDDIGLLIHTGGTTGRPKLTPISHVALCYQAWATAVTHGYRDDDVVVGGGPLFHVGGIVNASLAPLAAGLTVVNPTPLGFRDKAVVARYWELMAEHGVTRLAGVPTVLGAVVRQPGGPAPGHRPFRFSSSGSAALPAETANRFRALAGVDMCITYGMTEAAGAVSVAPRDGDVRPGSCGIAYPHAEVVAAVLGADGRIERRCGPDEIGRLIVRGPGIIRGYVGAAAERGRFLADGWFDSGDLGRVDANGYIWVTGRQKDLIIRGGHNIDPRLVEEALLSHPDVESAAAVGRPDAYAGELPVAFVTLRAGAAVAPDALLAHARAAVSERAAAPVAVEVVECLPLTEVGKVYKPELRAAVALAAYADCLAPLRDAGRVDRLGWGRDDHRGEVLEITTHDEPAAVEPAVREALGAFGVAYLIRREPTDVA